MTRVSARTRRTHLHLTRIAALVALAAMLSLAAACSSGGRRRLSIPPGGPKVFTVPQMERMVQTGTPTSVILGEMQRSGTVYRLTPQQERDLRAVGMPAVLITQMEQTYQHAVRKNPDLTSSRSYWTQIDGYWYGGLPFGWSRDWVMGATSSGQVRR
jgi:hypothetical protein